MKAKTAAIIPVPASIPPVENQANAENTTVESQALELDRNAVAQLAYSYWEARGREGGSAEEDWFRAEEELRARAANT